MGTAAKRGCLGEIRIGAGPTVVGELRNWRLSEEGAEIDVSTMGACDDTVIAGSVRRRLELSMYFADPDDAGQALLLVEAATMDFEAYPFGNSSGKASRTGTMNILTRNESADVGGAVELEVTASIVGAVTRGTVP